MNLKSLDRQYTCVFMVLFFMYFQVKRCKLDILTTNFVVHALKIFRIPIILETYGYAKSSGNSCVSLVWQSWSEGSDELVTRNNLDIGMQYLKSL